MPQKKASEPGQDAAECVPKIGKNNNVVQWTEAMQTELTAQFGLVGMFFLPQTRGMYNHFLERKIKSVRCDYNSNNLNRSTLVSLAWTRHPFLSRWFP
jgi:hypothetical protein